MCIVYEDRYYQIDADKAVWKYLDKVPDGHPLVALPTGSGKTPTMRLILRSIYARHDDCVNVLVVSHDKRILRQNAKTFEGIKDVAINSSGLGRREYGQLTVAGIQSIYNDSMISMFDYIIIDEAHTIPQSESSMYRKLFANAGKHTRIGLTATPYRTGQGYIVGEDHMFTKIVIDFTFGSKFTKLVKEGFISNLTINNTQIKLDTSEIHMQGGDYNLKEMSTAFNRKAITNSALDEMVMKGVNRKKWLVFAIDIDHAENIADRLNELGIFAMVVHSKNEFDNDFVLEQFNRSIVRCVVGVGMLTTGYDQPDIDLIGLLRPTQSPGLHVQMIGRGLRVFPGKDDCLVLDYAGNTERLGPINRIKPYKKSKSSGGGEPIIKTCEVCDTMVPPMTKICPKCGTEFKFKQLIQGSSGDMGVIADSSMRWFKVSDVSYSKHKKPGGTPLIKVRYYCGLRTFDDWIAPLHVGAARTFANIWLKKRGVRNTGVLNDIIATLDNTEMPKRIKVDLEDKYPQVIDHEFISDN